VAHCKTSLRSTTQARYQRKYLVAMEGRSDAVRGIAGGKENERRDCGISI